MSHCLTRWIQTTMSSYMCRVTRRVLEQVSTTKLSVIPCPWYQPERSSSPIGTASLKNGFSPGSLQTEALLLIRVVLARIGCCSSGVPLGPNCQWLVRQLPLVNAEAASAVSTASELGGYLCRQSAQSASLPCGRWTTLWTLHRWWAFAAPKSGIQKWIDLTQNQGFSRNCIPCWTWIGPAL